MTTSAKKINNNNPVNSSFESNVVSHVFPITEFEDLLLALSNSSLFQNYQIETPVPDVLGIKYDFKMIVMLNTPIWSYPDKVKDYLEEADNEKIFLVCVGKKEEYEHFKSFSNLSNHFYLTLPINSCFLHDYLNVIFYSVKRIEDLSVRYNKARQNEQYIKYLLSVSRELNGVRDIDKLLDLILRKTREITRADAGSLYIVEYDKKDISSGNIIFKITQNDSMPINLSEFKIPITNNSIVGAVVLRGEPINIKKMSEFVQNGQQDYNGIKHDNSIELKTGYQCKSMLTVPMFDIGHSVIGVIQLINCKIGSEPLVSAEDFEKRVVPFDEDAIEYAQILAHQAGIALENAFLTEDKQKLFESFVLASIKAIEQRDPTTSGHTYRVCKLTLQLAKVINSLTDGPFKDVKFSDDQLKELEFATLLHDFGKIGVREEILLKARKLFDWQLELIKKRFELAKIYAELSYLKETLMYMQNPFLFPLGVTPKNFEIQKENRIKELNEYLAFIIKCNEPTILEQGGFEKLKQIANTTFTNLSGQNIPLLTQEELQALSVPKGSLTAKEIAEIRNHVTHTYEFLKSIHWGKTLSNIPEIAYKHHEMIDGSGYPNGYNKEQIPIQSRIMAIADIFDALTAADRPYKKAVPIEKALEIIEKEALAGKYDIELFKVFKEYKCYEVIKDFH